MNWGKGIGYGALIWVIMFAIASALIAFDMLYLAFDMLYSWLGIVLMWILTAVITYILARKISFISSSAAFFYGILWAFVGIVLDQLITARFDSAVFSSWTYWVSYALIIIVPIVCASMKKENIVKPFETNKPV